MEHSYLSKILQTCREIELREMLEALNKHKNEYYFWPKEKVAVGDFEGVEIECPGVISTDTSLCTGPQLVRVTHIMADQLNRDVQIYGIEANGAFSYSEDCDLADGCLHDLMDRMEDPE